MMRPSIATLSVVLVLALVGCAPAAVPTPAPTETASPTAPAATPTPAPTPTPEPPPELTTSEIQNIALSSVLIEALIEEEGELVTAWRGSGTVLAPDGLILTNAHVVIGADALVISLISQTDQPPIPTYYAEPVLVSNIVDLALIQVTTDLTGEPVDRSRLRLPVVRLGDSDILELGQEIHVFGYPGVGGETVTFTQGTVSGFESEDLGGGPERVWIKTDAEIAPGNSGGTAVDDRGLLVGIPTAVFAEARTAGRISRLRPSNLLDYLTSPPPVVAEASIYEPNDDFRIAHGPLQPGEAYTAYLHDGDLDFYYIEVETLGRIDIDLAGPAGVDYDLGLFNANFVSVKTSESDTSQEHITYTPSSLGTYYILVAPYEGHSLEDPYVLQPVFNGEPVAPVVPVQQFATVRGRLVDANTGLGIEGAIFGLLVPGVTGEEYIADPREELIQAASFTDAEGIFVVPDVPRGQTYTAFAITACCFFWENDYLTLAPTGPALVDLGDILLSAG